MSAPQYSLIAALAVTIQRRHHRRDSVQIKAPSTALEQPREPTYRRSASVPNPRAIDHVLVRGSGLGELTEEARLEFWDQQVPLANGKSVAMSDHYAIETTIRMSWATPVGVGWRARS